MWTPSFVVGCMRARASYAHANALTRHMHTRMRSRVICARECSRVICTREYAHLKFWPDHLIYILLCHFSCVQSFYTSTQFPIYMLKYVYKTTPYISLSSSFSSPQIYIPQHIWPQGACHSLDLQSCEWKMVRRKKKQVCIPFVSGANICFILFSFSLPLTYKHYLLSDRNKDKGTRKETRITSFTCFTCFTRKSCK